MKLDLSINNIKKNIIETKFFEKNQYYSDIDKTIGLEHYSLFASIGASIKNSKIIEIGTCTGQSILAFSNSKNINNNQLFTYDINECSLVKEILIASEAIFSTTNLLDKEVREKEKDHILSADIIFIDIDPHTGILELEMLRWLKENLYKGLIILDDIYLAKPGYKYEDRINQGHLMYQNLWLKIPDIEKKCITNVGHASGTGIICFDFSLHEIIF
jgi:predicted O-methyltransferase YrrM